MIITVIWGMTPCSVVVKYSIIILREPAAFFFRVENLAEPTATGCLAAGLYYSNLKMEAILFSRSLVPIC
jgi:hypothetical protein